MLRIVAKIALFTAYCALLVSLLLGLKDLLLEYTDLKMLSPTMCYLANKLKIYEILSLMVATSSANFLKLMMLKYWTSA